MHELSITQSILDITLRYAQEANAQRVTDLYLVIGQLSSVVDESVQFYWDFVSKGSIADGATLHFKRIPLTMKCNDCQTEFTPDSEVFTCPSCDSDKISIITGEEFFLEAIDIDNGEENAPED